MNIHFKDRKLLEHLEKNTIVKTIIGSRMYGVNNANSDYDYLNIYLDYNYSFYWENHLLQFKEENIDNIFSDLKVFIRNLLSGDNTINFELIYSGQFKNTDLEFLEEFKEDLINYNTLRAYIGLARRDLKKFTSTKNLKKLAHCFRGYLFARQLLEEKNLDIYMNGKVFNGIDNDKEIYLAILNGNDELKYYLKELVLNLRERINKEFENGNINKIMSIKKLKKLDDYVKSIYKKYENTFNEIDYGDVYYNVLENGLKY
jgi:predicted nucleotidyltransferase